MPEYPPARALALVLLQPRCLRCLAIYPSIPSGQLFFFGLDLFCLLEIALSEVRRNTNQTHQSRYGEIKGITNTFMIPRRHGLVGCLIFRAIVGPHATPGKWEEQSSLPQTEGGCVSSQQRVEMRYKGEMVAKVPTSTRTRYFLDCT